MWLLILPACSDAVMYASVILFLIWKDMAGKVNQSLSFEQTSSMWHFFISVKASHYDFQVSEHDSSLVFCSLHNSIRCLAFCRAVNNEEPMKIKTKIGKRTPDCLSFHSSRPLLRSHWSVPMPSSLWFPWECPPQRHATTAWNTSFALQRKQRAQILDTSKTPSQVYLLIYYCTNKHLLSTEILLEDCQFALKWNVTSFAFRDSLWLWA